MTPKTAMRTRKPNRRRIVTNNEEPVAVDHRFILANERTFLAWMRTSLGLIAGGVALDQFVAAGSGAGPIRVIALVVIVVGAFVASLGVRQWHRADVAMHGGQPMPRTHLLPILGIGLAVIAIIIAIVLAFDGSTQAG